MGYLQAALGLIQIFSWVMNRIDAKEKEKALAALWEQEFMKRDKEILDAANSARLAARKRDADNPGGLLDHDKFESTVP